MHIDRRESICGLLVTCTMKRQNVRTLSLVVCTFTYLLIGAGNIKPNSRLEKCLI